MKNGIVLVRFDSSEGKDEAIQGGIYHFDNKPFIVKNWTPKIEFSKDELLSVPIQIKLPHLDFKYWSAKGLSKIGSLVGKPLMADKHTEKKVGLNFARLLVKVQIGSNLPEYVYFKNERGNVIEKKVTYNWQPSVCKVCQKYGHKEDVCRKNKSVVIEGLQKQENGDPKVEEETTTNNAPERNRRIEQNERGGTL